jgi:hypothetical protein
VARTEEQKAARRQREGHRRRMAAYGRWQAPYVDAGPARERLREFRDAGIGRRRASQLTGLHPSVISGIFYGASGRAPVRQVRRETEAAILAVPPLAELGARVGAAGTQRRIQALIATGRPLAHIARSLGRQPDNLRRVLSQPTVRASTAAEVRQLYDRVGGRMSQPKSPRGERRAAAARKLAADNGWPPPSAWSADQIDRPDGVPDEGWQEWQRAGELRGAEHWAAVDEDTRFLERTMGLGREAIAERLGMNRDGLDHMLANHRNAAPAGHQARRERFAAAAAGEDLVPDAEAG